LTEPTKDGDYFDNKALLVGQQAVVESDPEKKMGLYTDSMLYYASARPFSLPDIDVACALGELFERGARFFSSTKPPREDFLDFYVESARYLWHETVLLYEDVTVNYPNIIEDSVLAAREHVAQLMEEGHCFKGVDADGGIVPYSSIDIFDYRYQTAFDGFSLSQARVALSYREGKGVVPSFKQAAYWAGLAAPHINELPKVDASALFDLIAEIKLSEAHASGRYAASFPTDECRTGTPAIVKTIFISPPRPN